MLESCRALPNTKVGTHHGPCGNSRRDVTERPGLSRVRLFERLSRRRHGRLCELCLCCWAFSGHRWIVDGQWRLYSGAWIAVLPGSQREERRAGEPKSKGENSNAVPPDRKVTY